MFWCELKAVQTGFFLPRLCYFVKTPKRKHFASVVAYFSASFVVVGLFPVKINK
jgi:hypothetical protein